MRILTSLLTALITASGLAVATAGSASALGGETLACRVTPGQVITYKQNCTNSMGASSYQISFRIQNETAPSTYAWSISSDLLTTVVNGCTSTYNYCTLSVPNADNNVWASVTLTQNGATETLTSHAFIGQYCGTISCR
ncbi:hypothetical protein [Jatrophihabitans sp.]|uniref:hypothetical protein n=1 Tax=Jatrophihabitans sp. TaxID=1932789 RepID=UPI002C34BA18|nr:hypothetical protein [Jatrophihabitans sp.]